MFRRIYNSQSYPENKDHTEHKISQRKGGKLQDKSAKVRRIPCENTEVVSFSSLDQMSYTGQLASTCADGA